MRLFISDSQQRSAAAPNRLFANYSVNIIHYDLLRVLSESLRCYTRQNVLFSLFFAEAKLCAFDTVKDITLSSTEVTEQI